jgi:hypothetical protein
MSKKPKVHNLVDPDLRNLFLVHRDKYAVLKKKMDDASNNMRTYVKTIKGDGFSVMQIKDAIWMSTPEGEAEFKAEMANRMLAAAYIGADIGEQLSLFLDHSRTPLVDRAYKEGQAAAMRNEAAVPKYDPSTEGYRAFMEGFHDEQERQVKGGIGKLDAKAAKANANGKSKPGKPAKAAKTAKAAPAKPAGKRGRPPGPAKAKPADSPPRRPSAQPVTRAALAAAKKPMAETAGDEDSYFSRSEPAGNA